jgi:hypothetical protein
MKKLKHKHHIIPKHAGGSDDPSNIVLLTPEEHALAHKKLYEEFGRFQDLLAWKALSGQIGKEEIISTLMHEGSKIGGLRGGTANKKKHLLNNSGVWSEESKNKAKEKTKELGIYSLGGKAAGRKNVISGHLSRISSMGGKACKGLKWFHSKNENLEANLKECPEGWEEGRLKKPCFPKHVLSNGKGSTWWHCPITLKSKMIKPNSVPPDGWVRGRRSP